MSVPNCWASPTRVLIATDSACDPHSPIDDATLVLAPGEVRGPLRSAKLAVLPHCGAVIAVRGLVGFVQMMFIRCAVTPHSFDRLTEVAPVFMEDAVKVLRGAISAQGLPADLADQQELVLAGWSDARQRMEAWVNFSEGPGDIVRCPLDEFDWIEPWDDARPDPTRTPTFEDIAAHVRDQQRSFQEPGASIGGRLVVAEVTRTSVRIDTSVDLG